MENKSFSLKKMYETLDLMAHNIKLLRNVGIIPHEATSPSSWRWKLNRFGHSLIFLVYLTSLILQLLSFYFYWGNIRIIVECTGTTSGLTACYFPALYMMVNWQQFCTMVHKLETNSIFSAAMVKTNKKHMKIIQTYKRSAVILTWITIASITAVGASFDMIPLMRVIFSKERYENSKNVDRTNVIFDYLVFVMWLPGDLTEEYCFWYVYTIQAAIIFVACAYLCAILPFLLTIIIYTETQFRIVSSSLNEIDERYSGEDTDAEFLKAEINSEFNESEHAANNGDVRSLRFNGMHQLNSTKKFDASNTYTESDGLNDLTVMEATSNEHDAATRYLVECIKLHQAVIE
jgi:hypothetical protein